MNNWNPSSWRNFPIKQQPTYNDLEKLRLKQNLLLSSVDFCRRGFKFKRQLAEVVNGRAFYSRWRLCRVFFIFNARNIKDLFKVMMQMAVVLTFSGGCPIVKVGSSCNGQFVKTKKCRF